MGITLNIIEHELAGWGRVVRGEWAEGAFFAARLFLGSESLANARFLYICDDRSVPSAYPDYCFIYVGSTQDDPVPNAVLSILCEVDKLEILNYLSDVMYGYAAWERSLDELCFADAGIQALLDVSTPFLLNNVVVVDPALKLLAYTKDIPCDDPITMELIKHGYHTEENIRKFRLNKRFEPWASQDSFIINDTRKICKYVTVVYSFKTRNSFSVILVMMCNTADPEEWLLDTFSLFIKRAKRFVERDYPDEKPSGNMTDAFFRDLVDGKLSDEAAVRERCLHVGIPFQSRFCLFYLEPTGDDRALLPRVLADVSRVVAPAKTFLVGKAVAVLCFNCRDDACALRCAADGCASYDRSISTRLSDLLSHYGMVAGRSSKFSSLLDVRVAYCQAVESCALASLLSEDSVSEGARRGLEGIFSFDDLLMNYLMKCESDHGDELAASSYACRVLDSIQAADEHNKTDNYEFLQVYLECERRGSVVAERLHMHRNNVKYRITRIEELFGIDTDDLETRLDLLLAFRIKKALLMQNA